MVLQVLTVRQASMAVNYGLNKVRFPAPVPVGSKVRLAAEVASVEDIAGGVQIALRAMVHCTEVDKPICVAEPVSASTDDSSNRPLANRRTDQ
ncbi:hypothetical protein [Rhodococcus sp. IEGM 1307]|uniref:hypothetical protein n=1 Tax=Rhodococcus sp. IEGM 1307 TaxID=3047091 RepID=UPI0032D591E9